MLLYLYSMGNLWKRKKPNITIIIDNDVGPGVKTLKDIHGLLGVLIRYKFRSPYKRYLLDILYTHRVPDKPPNIGGGDELIYDLNMILDEMKFMIDGERVKYFTEISYFMFLMHQAIAMKIPPYVSTLCKTQI